MARHKGSTAFGVLSRSAQTSRRFEESIDQLTAKSIEQSLHEIEEALQQRYGTRPSRPKRAARSDS